MLVVLIIVVVVGLIPSPVRRDAFLLSVFFLVETLAYYVLSKRFVFGITSKQETFVFSCILFFLRRGGLSRGLAVGNQDPPMV